MNRRAFLGALASGGAVALAGCTGQRETLHSVSATPEIPSGEFYHEPLRLEGRDTQFNLQYEVSADHPFDAFLFGGQSDAEEFGVYQRAVDAAGDGRSRGGGHCGGRSGDPPEGRSRSGSGQGAGSGAGGGQSGTQSSSGEGNRESPGASGADAGGRRGRVGCPEPSGWHSVVGARGRGEVNKPLRPGTHHFVVDNTRVGAATPEGTLRPTIDLAVRDFELFSG